MTRHKEKIPKREVRCRWFAEELRKEVHWVVGYILYTSEDVSGSAFFKSFSGALQLAAFFGSVHQAEHLYKRSRLSLVPTISKFFKVRSAYPYQILHNKRRRPRLRSVFSQTFFKVQTTLSSSEEKYNIHSGSLQEVRRHFFKSSW